MVRHEDVGVDAARVARCGLCEAAQDEAVVGVDEEDRLAVGPTLDDVVREGRNGKAWTASHNPDSERTGQI